MAHHLVIVPYDPAWPERFAAIGRRLREGFGEDAIAIHHIGSTAVPGLAAKDIIDVQVTVEDLDAVDVDAAFAVAGVRSRPEIVTDHLPPRYRLGAAELRKRLGSIRDGERANVHVREAGRFNQRYPLLFRDHLRADDAAAGAYEAVKRALTLIVDHDADAYYAVKDPVMDLVHLAAQRWADAIGWVPPPSDA